MANSVNDDQPFASAGGSLWAGLIQRDVVTVRGPEAVAFLQGQLTQDVRALQSGESAWSFVLQPHGKLDAMLRVTRIGNESADGDSFVIDVEAGVGETVVARLRRFVLRTKVEISLDTKLGVAIRNPAGDDAGDKLVLQRAQQIIDIENSAQVIDALWPQMFGKDVLVDVDALDVSKFKEQLGEHFAIDEDEARYEQLRIIAGVPSMRRELDEKTIPNEIGYNDLAVSFTKGCYTGQELVARIDSRGNRVPRRLVRILIDADSAHEQQLHEIALPAVITESTTEKTKKPAGLLTSLAIEEMPSEHTATSSGSAASGIGLAWLKREFENATEVMIETGHGDGHMSAKVLDLLEGK